MAVDTLFACIEKLQGDEPWGSVLDAGTGKHSLGWMENLPTTRWTAVTGDPRVADKLKLSFAPRMRPADEIVCGNWSDAAFLHGRQYEVVIADYLLGAVEGFARYYQDRLFERLKPHVGSRLYVVGLEPYPRRTSDPWGQVIVEIARLRDACILLAGQGTYREYPLEWTLRHLEFSRYRIDAVETFPVFYGKSFVNNQLRVAERKLPDVHDRALATELKRAIDALRERALEAYEAYKGTPFGEDYVIAARL